MIKKDYKCYISLILWVISLLFISSMIGLFSRESIDTWYKSLDRSPLTPPDAVFGITWTILYTLIAAAGWFLWKEKASNLLKGLFALQLGLNWIWMPLFFGYHLTGHSLFTIILLVVTVGSITVLSYKKLPTVSWLLSPYFIWILFASYLNAYIWLFN